jgi:hypothetical protein
LENGLFVWMVTGLFPDVPGKHPRYDMSSLRFENTKDAGGKNGNHASYPCKKKDAP